MYFLFSSSFSKLRMSICLSAHLKDVRYIKFTELYCKDSNGGTRTTPNFIIKTVLFVDDEILITHDSTWITKSNKILFENKDNSFPSLVEC